MNITKAELVNFLLEHPELSWEISGKIEEILLKAIDDFFDKMKTIKINSSEPSKDSMYYPYSLKHGRSIHLERTSKGDINIWDSKMVKEGMTRDEALNFLQEYMKNE